MYYSMWHFIANCFTQFIMQPKWCILNSRCHLTSVLASEKRWKFAFFCSHFLALLFLLFWVTLITGHFRLVLDTNALFDVTNLLSSNRPAIFYDWNMKYASNLAILFEIHKSKYFNHYALQNNEILYKNARRNTQKSYQINIRSKVQTNPNFVLFCFGYLLHGQYYHVISC